jgi:vacuolar-type H+-ATPase subunit E/Vma4
MEHPILHDTMTKEVLARCDAILNRARREGGSIEAEARRLAAEQREKVIAEAHAEAERMAAEARLRAQAQAELAGRSMQQQVVDDLLNQTEGELSRLADTVEFVPLLGVLLAEALADVEDVGLVKAPPDHVERVREWLTERGLDGARVEGEPGLSDGVVVEDRERTLRVTNTLSRRLATLWPQARKHCHDRLFGDGVE